MKLSFHDSWVAAEFVNDQLLALKPGSQSTMTIIRENSEGFSASIAIEESSDDTDLQRAKFFSDTQLSI